MSRYDTLDKVSYDEMILKKMENVFCRDRGDNKVILSQVTDEKYKVNTVFKKKDLIRYAEAIKNSIGVSHYKPNIDRLDFFYSLFDQIQEETGHSDFEIYLMFIFLDTNMMIKARDLKEFRAERESGEGAKTHVCSFSEDTDIMLGIEADNWEITYDEWKEMKLVLSKNPTLEEASETTKRTKLDCALMALEVMFFEKKAKCYKMIEQILWSSVRPTYDNKKKKNKAK